MRADPSNRFVFATSLGGGLVMQFRFDARTRPLTPNDAGRRWPCRAGAGPRHLVFHPDGAFVYLLNELDASVDVLALDRAARHAARRCRRCPRCRPASPASPGPPTCTSRPMAAFSTPASAAPARWPASRSTPASGRLSADRPLADAGAAARLRDHALGPLADRRRAAVARASACTRIDAAHRRAEPAARACRRPQPQLGRGDRAALTRPFTYRRPP